MNDHYIEITNYDDFENIILKIEKSINNINILLNNETLNTEKIKDSLALYCSFLKKTLYDYKKADKFFDENIEKNSNKFDVS